MSIKENSDSNDNTSANDEAMSSDAQINGGANADEYSSTAEGSGYDECDEKTVKESEPLQPKMVKSKSGHKLKEVKEVNIRPRGRPLSID